MQEPSIQEYRINFRILIGLIVGSIISAVLLYFLWKWQVNRKATWYLDTAEVALQEEDALTAFQYMQYFVKLRTKDDAARIKLASIAFDVLDDEGAPRDDRGKAFQYIGDTVRRTNDEETRHKLADFYFQEAERSQSEQMAQQAKIHYEELLKNSEDTELKARYVRSLFIANDYQNATKEAYELIGFDPEKQAFDSDEAVAVDQPEVYADLANVLLNRENKKRLAKQVIDKMIENNPESAVAHLQYAMYLFGEDDKEAGVAELNRAFELDPENPQILMRKIQLATMDKDPNQAIALAKSGIEKFPKSLYFYVSCSNAYLQADKQEEAIAILDKGILEFGEQSSVRLFEAKFDTLLSSNDIKGCQQVIEELVDLKVPALQPLIDFKRARIAHHLKQWRPAARQLNKVRPQLVRDREKQIEAGYLLADSYERLGMNDKALEFYGIITNDESIPDSNRFKLISRHKLAKLEEAMDIGDGAEARDFNSVVSKELEKDEKDQDWDKIAGYIDRVVELNDLSEASKLMLEAEVLRKRGLIEDAKAKIVTALKLDKENVRIKLTAAQILLVDLPEGPPKALRFLKQIEEQSGATLQTRLLMMEALVRSTEREEMVPELIALSDDADGLSKEDKSRLYDKMGEFLTKVGEIEEAERITLQAADLDPSNLLLRKRLFELALSQRDEAKMQRALDSILEVVETKDDGEYILAEVRRRLISYRGDSAGKKGLREAQRMLDDVLKERPQWHELHIVYAQLLLVTKQDTQLVLERFDDALRYGPPNPMALAQQVSILAENKMMDQARIRMERMPQRTRNFLLGRTEADILLATGDIQAAYESAKQTSERNASNARLQAWFGGIADLAGNTEEAADAFRRATKLNPKSEQYWMNLVSVQAKLEDLDGVVQSMRSAQLALTTELVPVFQAKLFELQKQWKSAESIYTSTFDNYETNQKQAYQLAAFYLRWGAANPEVIPRAFPYVNAILKMGHDGKLKLSEDRELAWAVERAAVYLAARNNYQDFLKALRVIRQASDDGSIPGQMMPQYLGILTSSSDPDSISEAIGILTSMYEKGTLNKSQQLLLAGLYERTLQWEKGKDLMIDALSRYDGDQDVWKTYIELLIKQGEYTTAKGRIDRFRDISDKPADITNLRAKLAYTQGDRDGLRKALRSMLPKKNLQKALTLDDLKVMKSVALVAMDYEEWEFSEQLLRLYVRRKNPDGVMELATILATHGDVDEALRVMDSLFQSNPLGMARLAVQALRERHRELDELQTDHYWSFIQRVIDERPDAPERLMLRAEAHEVREMYEQAIADYESAIELGLDSTKEAIAFNNLAYLLANTGQRLDDAARMIEASAEELGPLADILDTRAVIRIAREEYDLAVEDMEKALSIDPTASKYYHLARAQALAGNSEAALEAWEKAREMNIAREDLPLVEQSSYDATERTIEQLQGQ